MDLTVGIVVTLKSGGPSMTVSEIKSGSEDIKCIWFDHGGVIHEYQFNQNAIVEVNKMTSDTDNKSFEVAPDEEIPF